VLSSSRTPVFAKQNYSASRSRTRPIRGFFFGLILFLAPSHSRADSLADAAQALAGEVASIRNLRGPFVLEWQNSSSLESLQSDALRAQFSTRLAALRVTLNNDPSAPPMRVSLGETPTLLVFVASVRVAESEQDRFVTVPRAAYSPEDIGPSVPRLLKQLLWKQGERILDAAEIPAAQANQAGLLVLSENSLSLYRMLNNTWVRQAAATLPGAAPAMRAPEGRISLGPDQPNNFVLDLPDKVCNGTLGDQLVLDCLPNQRGASKRAAPVSPLSAPCDNFPWTLSSGKGDWTVPDSLFLINPRSATAAPSASLDVPGPVLSISSSSDSRASLAVIFNLSTGYFEVYRVTLACGN
jgi:hypothetical protein